jgi:hypothetical protein
MEQPQRDQFATARVVPMHLSSATSVVATDYSSVTAVTDYFVTISSVAVSNSVWCGQEPLVDSDWLVFSELAVAWKKETGLSSSIRRKYASEHYKRILRMGRKAAFLIIRQLQLEGNTPYHWWDALRQLTDHDPVPPEVGGDVRTAARIWIEWARQHAGQLETQ